MIKKSIDEYLETRIDHPDFVNAHKMASQHFSRRSRLSFSRTTVLILRKMSTSLQIEANLMGELLNEEPVSKQAISKARQKIAVSAFQDLHHTGLEYYYTTYDTPSWKGYRILGGDGSTLQFPRRGNLPDFFGDHFERTTLGRVMQYVDLMSDVVVAADLMPYRTSENEMAKYLLPKTVEKLRSWGEDRQIYVYDRGFPSHAFAQRHVDLNVDFLFRVQKRYSREISKIVEQGQTADYKFLAKRGQIHYEGRVIVRYLSSGQPLVLVTSLLDENEWPSEDVVKLYQHRWRCEEAYKFQKVLMSMDNMHHRTYQAAAQEFWASIVVAMCMAIRFNEIEQRERQNKDPKSLSKINRTVVYGSCRTLYLRTLLGDVSWEDYEKRFLKLCKRHRVRNRPERNFPRLSAETRKTRHCHRRF